MTGLALHTQLTASSELESTAVGTASSHSDASSAAISISRFVTTVCIIVLWLSAGDHPLYSPDEGRYGVVGLHMVEGGSWLTPVFEEHVHLTKPPLEYWAIALSIKVLGRTELAVRLPSLLAGTASILILTGFARRRVGARTTALAVGTLSLMPLFILTSRMATTDALLNASWLGALVCGYLAIDTRKAQWAWLMWLAIGTGLITKGPLALVPLGLIALWLAFAGRWRELRHLRLIRGVVAALLPLAVWVGFTIALHPDAIDIWKHEMLDRATGAGDHVQPWWFYIPLFLAGLFPATAMLVVPGWNVRISRAWSELRRGSLVGLLAISIVVPLIGFSLMAGKLPSYLLPICAPLALLTGMMLEQWIRCRNRTPDGFKRLPDVRITLTICIIGILVVAVAGTAWFKVELLVYVLPLALTCAACIWLWRLWTPRPGLRSLGLAVVWCASILSWWSMFELEDALLEDNNPVNLMQRLFDVTGTPHPIILTYGFTDPTLSFYNDREVYRLRPGTDAAALLDDALRPIVVLVNQDDRSAFDLEFTSSLARLNIVGTWHRNARHDVTILMQPARRSTPEQL